MTSVHKQMAKGAAWMVLFKLAERSIGLVSTIILARLLVPEDFGLVALAMAVIALVELLGAFSFDVVLIQKQQADRSYYDTAWTFNVVIGALSALVLLAVAQPIASFYDDERLAAIVRMLSLVPLVASMQNIGIVAFRKEMQFHKEFVFLISKKLISFAVTLALALTWRDYWALIYGMVAGRLATSALSYWVHPYRARFSIARRKELFSFSIWLFLMNVTNFITNRVPDFIVGKIAGTHVLGLYSVAYEISNLPTTELVAPINRAVFPGYAKLSSDLAALREGYLSVLRMIALLTLPAVFGIAATANVFVPLVLGDKWLDAVELVEVLAFYGMLIAAENNTGSVYLAQGVPRLSMLVGLAHNCLRVPALIVGATQAGAYGAAMGILLAGAIMVPVNLTIVFRRLELGFMDFIRVFWRPLLAGISMFLAVAGMERYMGFGHDTWMMLIALAGLVCFGAATYVLIVLVLWTLSGRPDGAERALLAQAARHMTKAWSR